MNFQDVQSLEAFLGQLVQARGVVKDPQADSLIASAVAQQPDAAYLLVQRALLMEQALNGANARIAALQSQLQAAQSPPAHGFLDAEAWGNSAVSAPRPAVGMPDSPAYVQSSPPTAIPPAAPPDSSAAAWDTPWVRSRPPRRASPAARSCSRGSSTWCIRAARRDS